MARLSTEERQILIIDEAIKIIHELGYQAFSIRELSKRVGISEPAIYRHFLNKEDIVLGILGRFNEFDLSLFQEIKKYEKPIEKINRFVRYHFEFLEKNPGMTSIIFAEEIFNQSDLLREKMLAIIERRKKLIKSIFDEAQAKKLVIEVETNELVKIILGFIRMVILEWRMSGFSSSLSQSGKKAVNTIEKLLAIK
ncbi:MAG: helix-turn-helix transcriptional regulator [Melioribacteraceae bacterium]|jgi:AcrR family transcriptional regulator|nr:helix-turn-helix transcriptional regulator [Melioribacteraceae bacterium]